MTSKNVWPDWGVHNDAFSYEQLAEQIDCTWMEEKFQQKTFFRDQGVNSKSISNLISI